MTGPSLTPAPAQEIASARASSDALGLYFRLADPAVDPGSWRPAAPLYEAGAGPLDRLLDSVRARLGGCERRVAASLFYQGFAARLVSPQLGCLATAGRLPALAAGQLSWRAPATEMIQLGVPAGPGWQGPAELLLDQLLVQSFTGHLDPLAAAIRSRIGISADLLRDNAASALVNGLRLLDQHVLEWHLAGGWRPLATRALADPLLRGCGTLTPGGPGFVRRSCCLYYRTPGGGLCGDCPLV